MIRKNDPNEVTKITAHVAGMLAKIASSIEDGVAGRKPLPDLGDILDDTLNALEKASKLSGVGPATASLILSVCDPVNMSFFEDEMFDWVCFDLEKAKLKYDKKEYSELVKRVWKMRERLTMEVIPEYIEKTSFVLEHWALVDEKDQDQMPESNEALMVDGKDVAPGDTAFDRAVDKQLAKEAVGDAPHEKEAVEKQETGERGTKRGRTNPEQKAVKDKESDAGTRRSKRVKK